MSFQKKRVMWKRVRPTSLRDAFRLCKDHAKDKKNHSVSRIAELMAVTEDTLYKWLGNGRMPATLIPVYENVCGIHLVTEYLAASTGRVVIEIPTGKPACALEMNELQAISTEAIGKLIRFYSGDADLEETETALTNTLKAMAQHRVNIHKAEQPELEL